MSHTSRKFVARAVNGSWRIFNRKTKRFWGNYFDDYPEDVLMELNNLYRPEVVTQLCKKMKPKPRFS